MTQETKTLELALQRLSGQKIDFNTSKNLLHYAVFLSTIEAASQVIGPRVAPTPLYRIAHENGTLKFDFLEGKGKVPTANSTDIDYADLVYSSFQCDKVALLSEGTTGTGKTYTLEQVLKTIYAPENIRGLRLNASMSNVLQPYIEGKIDPNEGVLRININKKAVREIAALFIDEQNRGDTNAVLGLLDNQVVLPTGERADIGLPIPKPMVISNKIVVSYNDDRVKPVAVHSAQNPPDAQYTGARRTDGAVGNRQVRINFPNMALNSGAATLNMTGRSNHHHEDFMQIFTKKLASYLKIDEKELGQLLLPQNNTAEEKTRANQEYLNLHAFSFDPAHSQNKFLRSAVEGADHIIMLTGGNNLEENFKDELETAKEWTEQLKQYKVNFQYNTKIDPKSELLLRIDAVRSGFSEQLIERDKTKATKIADALALIMRYKQAYKTARENKTSPLEEFMKLQTPLTLADIASAYAIVLNDKVQTKSGTSPVTIINQAFADYTSLLTAFSNKVYPKDKPFKLDINDPGQSIRYVCAYMAVKAISQDKNATADQYAKKMIDALDKTASIFRTLDDGSDTKKLLAARINADIASFAGFIHEYRKDIAEALNKVAPSEQILPRYNALTEIVQKARNEVQTNYTLPRVERIFGV